MKEKIKQILVPFTATEYRLMTLSAAYLNRPRGQHVRILSLRALKKSNGKVVK